MLHNNYIPWQEKEIPEDFLAISNHKIPKFFFKPKLDPVDKDKNYFDQTHSHPNVFKRRKILNSLIAIHGIDSSKSLFVFSEEDFKNIKTLCQFETLNQELRNGLFGDALYNIDILKRDFPNNAFLDKALAKSLYSLSIFKLYDNFPAVGRAFIKTEGQSQQVHYLLLQLDAKQVSSLALAHLYALSQKYPKEDMNINMADELTKSMLIRAEIEANEYSVGGKVYKFRKLQQDFDTEIEFIRAGQEHYKDFHKYLLDEAISSGWLASSFRNHYGIRDS